jgi:hypothetical protein
LGQPLIDGRGQVRTMPCSHAAAGGGRKHADIDGKHLKTFVEELAVISRKTAMPVTFLGPQHGHRGRVAARTGWKRITVSSTLQKIYRKSLDLPPQWSASKRLGGVLHEAPGKHIRIGAAGGRHAVNAAERPGLIWSGPAPARPPTSPDATSKARRC